MLKAYIVDDEPLARDELKYLLNRSKEVETIGESDCIEVATVEIPEHKPDIIFIDIELDAENGLSLAKALELLEPAPAIVFATAYDEYALQAFEANAIDYLLKPIDEERLKKTIEKINKLKNREQKKNPTALRMNKQHNEKLVILVEERMVLLNQDDIIFLQSSEGKSTVKTIEQEYKVTEPLIVLEKKLLNNPSFVRVHRSFIVHVNHIVEIEPWFNSTYNLKMKDGSQVPVSRTYVKDLKRLIGF